MKAAKNLSRYFYNRLDGISYLDYDDFVQEIAIVIWKFVESGEAESEGVRDLEAFCRKRANNACIDACRVATGSSNGDRPIFVEIEDFHNFCQFDHGSIFLVAVFDILNDLTDNRFCEIFQGCYIEEKTLLEVANEHGISRARVGQLRDFALHQVQERLCQ
jgi:RNA polymerase sigma factor (sigma-70 family)